jgi:phosphomannomutase
MLYWAVSELEVDGGIQITGSHNPADYNGFKMLLPGGSVFGAAIKALGTRSAEGRWSEGKGQVSDEDVMDRYVARLVEDFRGGEYRIGWDAGNGAAGPALEKLIKLLPGEHHTLFTDVDGRFPNHHPDPTVEKNLEHLKALVRDKNLDFGIAFDGDGDRIGAVDGQGRVIWGDQLLMILAGPVLQEQPGATIIADVKASQTLFDRIAEMGGKPLMWKTGHSLIKSKMKETGAPLAGEMSGHIFFKHRWYGFDDALYASVRLIEAVAASGKSLTQLREEMPTSVPPPSFASRSTKAASSRSIEKSATACRRRRDGRRDRRRPGQHAEGWWLLRASNTQDVLVARAEATDQRGLDLLVAEIDQQLALSEIERTEQTTKVCPQCLGRRRGSCQAASNRVRFSGSFDPSAISMPRRAARHARARRCRSRRRDDS